MSDDLDASCVIFKAEGESVRGHADPSEFEVWFLPSLTVIKSRDRGVGSLITPLSLFGLAQLK